MSKEYKLQDPGEGINEAEILDVYVKPGDDVSEGDHVLDAETDKSAVEIRADFTGTVDEVKVQKGQTVQVGDVLITYGADGETKDESHPEDKPKDVEKSGKEKTDEGDEQETSGKEDKPKDVEKSGKEEKSESQDAQPSEGKSNGSPRNKAAPATRKLARQHGVDLSQLEGTGPAGRVLDEDVLQAAGEPPSRATPAQPSARHPQESSEEQPVDKSDEADRLTRGTRVARRERMSSIRRATARAMTQSARDIPHVMHHDVVRIDDLEKMRQQHAELADDKERPSLTAYLVKALAGALRLHPRFNVRLDGENQEIVHLDSIHIGVAVATERGLLVPVLRDVDRLSLRQTAVSLRNQARRAHAGELQPSDMRGASITLTNVGGIGGRSFTPIINAPEASILGVGASYTSFVPREKDGAPEASLQLPLSFCFDHRINDGAGAAHFVNTLKSMLSNAARFALET